MASAVSIISRGGSVYWSPSTGAHSVKGRIRDFWSSNGWETGRFGYPTTEEFTKDGAIQQNFQGGDIQWVPPKRSSLPRYESSWGSYSQVYTLFSPEQPRWSPAQINREVTTHFDSYFTFTGCGSVLTVGATCDLDTVTGDSAPVKVVAISDTGFAFLSLAGHPEGEDRYITFNFERHRIGGSNDVRLHVSAWGPRNFVTALGPLNSETIARYSWSRFSKNIQERINDASTTYITADKSGMRVRRDVMQDPIANTEYIDPSNVDTSSVGNKVPLEPLPLSGNSEPESVPPGKGDVDFGNLNQDGNETHTEPN